MSEFFPSNESHESSYEVDTLKAQLERLHERHEAARMADAEASQQIDLTPGARGDMAQSRFIVVRNDSEVMSSLYDEIIWTPRRHTRTARSVGRIAIRHPLLTGPAFNQFDDGIQPNDIFIAINHQKYLMNNKGIIPYGSSEAVEYDDTELFQLDTEGLSVRRPNLFTVVHPQRRARVLLPSVLKIMLDESAFHQQPLAH